MKLFLSTTVVMTMCVCNCNAQLLPNLGNLSIGTPDWDDPIQCKLYAFCQVAMLKRRGMTATPLGGSSDDRILSSLLPNERFRAALAASEVTSLYADSEDNVPQANGGRNDGKSASGAVLPLVQRTNPQLFSKLSADERKRLPGVYLHVEGLIALCRRNFIRLFEDRDKQRQIREMAESHFQQRVAPLHQAAFVLGSTDERPTIEASLRYVSAELDWRIVQLLSQKERERLLDLIHRSRRLSPDVEGAPPF